MDDFDAAAWIETLQARAATIEPAADVEITIEQRLDDGTVWHIRLSGGRAEAVLGPNADADLRIATTRASATAIADGRLSAQRAFLDGEVQIGGDIGLLLTHREALAQVAELLRAT